MAIPEQVIASVFALTPFQRNVIFVIILAILAGIVYYHFKAESDRQDNIYTQGYTMGLSHPDLSTYAFAKSFHEHHNSFFSSDNDTYDVGYLDGYNASRLTQ